MIIDTSVIIAIMADEDDASRYAEKIGESRGATISAANYLESAIVLDKVPDPRVGRALDQFLLDNQIGITSVTPEMARLARGAYRDFGRGSGHRARLNFGDCFAYALAIERNEHPALQR